MHGKPGSPGAPGRDGRDGRDGVKGDQGSLGKTGPQGPPGSSGINGKNGAKGEPGSQGPPGQKGQRGESGTSGIPGTPGVMSYKNWKECAWKNLNDGKDHGLIKVNVSFAKQTFFWINETNWELQKNYVFEFCFTFFIVTFLQECLFTKKFSDTSLHVYWTGVLRISSCDYCCKRWYFTFNGAECAAPLPIDGIVYMLKSKSQNIHRVNNIEGHCSNIHKGKVRVGFWVGNCAGYSGRYDAKTGWNSVSRIFIEEVSKPQA